MNQEILEIGVTERGDPSLDKSFLERLRPANIIITKNPGALFPELLEHKDKIILHATITGMGGSIMEPNVPPAKASLEAVKSLIIAGFPAEQIVLRVDPVIPVGDFLKMAENSIAAGAELVKMGVRRMRYSIIDLYPHVRQRLKEAGITLYIGEAGNFTLKGEAAKKMAAYIEGLGHKAGFSQVAACGEFSGTRIGCVSAGDLIILGLDPSQIIDGSGKQRKSCLCCANKRELLPWKNSMRCGHQCLYCYWK